METYKVLLGGTDQKNLKDIIDKTKQCLSAMPLEFEIVEDGKRLMNEVRFRKPILVFIEWNLPGYTGLQLQQEIQRQISDVSVFFMGFERPVDLSESSLWLTIPIVNWENFKDQVVDGLPIDIKMRYAIDQKEDPLLLELIEYGKKYQFENTKTSQLRNQILMMPSFHPAKMHDQKFKSNEKQSEAVKVNQFMAGSNLALPKSWIYYEYALLCLSILGSLVSFWSQDIAQLENAKWIQVALLAWTSLILVAVLLNRKITHDQSRMPQM